MWAALLLGLPLIDGGTTYIPVTLMRVWVLLMAGAWMLYGLSRERFVFFSGWYNLPILLFWVLCMLWLAISPYLYQTMYWYLNILCYIAIFYLGLQTLAPSRDPDGRRLKFLAWMVLLMAGFQGLFALAEALMGQAERANGTFFNPGFLTGYFIGVGPLALSLLIFNRGRKHPVEFAALVSVLVFISLGVVATQSRAAIIWLLALGCVMFVRYRWWSVLAVLVCVVLLLVVPNPLGKRVLSLKQTDPYSMERINIWRGGVQMIHAHPLGVGLGMYKYYSTQHVFAVEGVDVGRYGKYAKSGHNEFLHLAAEMSLLAPLVLLGLVAWPIWLGVFARKRSPGLVPAIIAGAASGLLGITLHAFMDSNLHNPSIAVLAALLMAMLVCALGREKHSFVKEHILELGARGLLAGVVGMASLVLFAFFIFLGSCYSYYMYYRGLPDPVESANKLDRLPRYMIGYAPLFADMGNKLFFAHRSQYQGRQNVELLERAIQKMEAAYVLNPLNYLYPRELGQYYLAAGGIYDEAGPLNRKSQDYFERSLELNPSEVIARRWLSWSLRRQGLHEDALLELDRALDYEPYYFAARLDRVELLDQLGRKDQARAGLEQLLEMIREASRMTYLSAYQRKMLELNQGVLETMKDSLLTGSGPVVP